ncbi:hypothetical protein ITI46_18320 [Streptomyces oryzae]|uniref:DNA-directed RNA polymerase specialized sigma24 family protein n=1 Tax=Streptomyces oryzae TaxID=1434886 RepID=A0ABS3XE03_9ACTN|nr:hypothetical protein [Streptomyces oryzae]MBO8193600.1 hypothetical protein [Streptomyces oryzae]
MSEGTLDVEQAELALVEHYERLVRLAYCVLGDGPRRALAAHELTRGALPTRCTSTAALPGPRRTGEDPAYAWLRLRVLRAALPRPRGEAPARAAYALRHLEGLADQDIRQLLSAARVKDPDAALAEAGTGAATGTVAEPAPGPPDGPAPPDGGAPPCPLCRVQAPRPLDVVRRRRYWRAAGAAVFAAVVAAVMLGAPGDTWGPDAAARPPVVRGTDGERALDPGALARARPGAWRRASRTDFAAWPARGALTRDESLLRRALVTWARPRADVRVTAAPGTPKGPPPGPPQLLYAGRLDGFAVVLLYDGLRVARYAEPLDPDDGSAAAKDGVSLELARTAGAGTAASGALVVSRGEGEVRYLAAPWISHAAQVDLRDPADVAGRALSRDEDGVTERVPLPVTLPRHCENWPGLALRGSPGAAPDTQLYTDLGELTPARLTDGKERAPATGAAARGRLAHTVCHLPAVLDEGVKAVNSWQFARQRLPDGDGAAAWVCTRAGTWRGAGARVMTQFQPSAAAPGRPGAVTSRAEDTRACGPRARKVLTGLLWKSTEDHWYVLAAGDESVTRLRARGSGLADGPAETRGNTLAVRAERDTSVRLSATRANRTRARPAH